MELPEVELPDLDEIPAGVAAQIELFPFPDEGVAEPVYPEFYLIPGVSGVFKIGKYALRWLREWQRGRGRVSDKTHRQEAAANWKPRYGNKSPKRWENQFSKRGWTYAQVRHFILKGRRTEADNYPNPSNGASKYQIGDDFIIMDDTTHELLQISDKTRPFY